MKTFTLALLFAFSAYAGPIIQGKDYTSDGGVTALQGSFGAVGVSTDAGFNTFGPVTNRWGSGGSITDGGMTARQGSFGAVGVSTDAGFTTTGPEVSNFGSGGASTDGGLTADYIASVNNPSVLIALNGNGNELRLLYGANILGVNAEGVRVNSAKNHGSVTLSGGTGTATVVTNSTCVCSLHTGTVAPACTVSTATLSIVGFGTDIIDYLCF